ncbi:MAG: class I SAM-dependent methyltransferase [Verrucomicrobiaceae bacterium]|nr:MAG: class I SAM-dependent methyltransferase [Verrucomicrobiaceae bacterium]
MSGSRTETPIPCPVCETVARLIREEPAESLREDLAGHFGTRVGLDRVEISSYQLLKCPECTLEFANPMKPGSSSFYEWVCRQPGYYPPDRWEYAQFDEMVREVTAGGRPFRVLDVGCGSGRFLKRMKESFGEKVECTGVDITPGALSQAGDCGIQFILGDHRELDPKSLEPFDLVTSFHCLEHVEDPRGFVSAMTQFARPDGKISVSTPLSPMSFEFEWDAIMNRPPHHMSRWNEKAYRSLGNRLGLSTEFHSERAASVLGRTSNSTVKAVAGYNRSLSKTARYGILLANPLRALRHLRYQMSRPTLNGRPRGEDILVIFRGGSAS